MTDIRTQPDAWEMIERLAGEEGSSMDSLYEIYYQISTAIFDYRLKHKLSQKKLAEKLGVSQPMVAKLESGNYNCTIEQLWKIANKLGFAFNIEFEEKEQVKRIASGNKYELKKYKAIFWDTDIDEIDLERNKSKIIERIINLGNEKAYKWLWQVYPEDVIIAEIKTNRNIDKKAALMMANIFDIPREEIQCLKNVHIEF
ncbi:MAG: helix-turn-helix domain-containing protein [Methanocorpusculum sp.]|nr:helix-turn-helix domain-containing protein [Methanocorpusculum sp.]